MKAAVVIPFYKTKLSPIEQVSLKQCNQILKKYDIFYAAPVGLNPASHFLPFKTVEFSPEFFKDIHGYNRLMLESQFYEKFLDYDYILLYQLDAFVFRDELLAWCNKGYDYIGAPWIATDNSLSQLLKPFLSKKVKKREPIFYRVGNGGFSLRKTEKFYKISRDLKDIIEQQLNEKKDEIYAIEDVFWSLKVPELYPDFRIPGYQEALNFAIDRKPKIALKLNKNKLPFGCHGVDKPKVIEFWKPIIEKAHKENCGHEF